MTYYVQLKGKVLGPLNEERLQKMLELGQVSSDCQISQDKTNWLPITQVPAFANIALPMPPPPARQPPPAERRSPRTAEGTTTPPVSRPPENVTPTRAVGVFPAALVGNKLMLFTIAGLVGGAIGDLVSEVIMNHDASGQQTFIALVLYTGFWGLLWCIGITTAILGANEAYARRPPISLWVVVNGLWKGALCGFVSGAIAQAFFSLPVQNDSLRENVFRPACWGIAGMLIGLLLSFSIPNLGKFKGAVAGLLGGVVGGGAFVMLNVIMQSSSPIAGGFSRMVGIGIIGAAVGLAITVTEAVFRTAYAEIFWGPNEKTTVTLGIEPVWFGGGRSQIFIKELPERAAGIVMRDGRIIFTDTTGAQRTLGDGESLKIGRLRVVVHARN